jgi:type III pantothenate kinase
MNVLLADLGNTRLKWAWLSSERLGASEVIDWHTPDAPESTLAAAWSGLPRPEAIWLSPLARSATTAAVCDWCQRTWGVEAHVARAESERDGLRNGYRDSGALGADRWLGMLAAHAADDTRRGFCVADCGTALTVDCVGPDGAHLGGYILPGLARLRSTLLASTGLDVAKTEAPGRPGRDTATGLAEGAIVAMAGVIAEAHRQLRLMAAAPRLVMTGGDAATVLPRLDLPAIIEPDLVLQGLARLVQGDCRDRDA